MSNVTNSPNMLLPIPIPSQDPGPDWALNYSACLTLIDQHNHTINSGVQISQDGISLTAGATTLDSLSFNGSNAFALRSVRFNPQAAALALATDLGCIYEAGVDLYYNDGSGNHIRLTQGGSIVGTAGSITGLPSGTASASFAAGTFVWQSATNTAANMDAGSYIYRNATASSKGLTLSPPNAMAADYQLFLPSIPGAQSIMSLDASGNMAAGYTVDNSTIVIASNVIEVPASGIGTTQLAASSVTLPKLASSALSYLPHNYSIAASVAGNALTFSLKDAGGSAPSATSPVVIPFRNTTLATGTPTFLSFTGAASITLPSGTAYGMKSGSTYPIWIYAVNSSSTAVLGFSLTAFDEGILMPAAGNLVGGSGASQVIVTTAGTETNFAYRLLGVAIINQATAGTYVSLPTEISNSTATVISGQKVCAVLSGSNGATGSGAGFSNVKLDTVVFDNTVSTGTSGSGPTQRYFFNAPKAGRYRFSISVEISYPGSVSTFSQLRLLRNNTPYLTLNRLAITTNAISGLVTVVGSQILDLAIADSVTFDFSQQNGSATTATTNNYFSIEEI